MGDGRLTFEKFCLEAELLQRRSHELASKQNVGTETCVATWEWRHGNRRYLDGNSYLVSNGNVRQYKFDANTKLDKKKDGDIDELLFADEESLKTDDEAQMALQNEGFTTVLLEFHIVYHNIYQTPVLYFQAVELDGIPVSTVAITRNVEFAGSNERSTNVTLDDHPILGRPFLLLHPCETAAAMQLLQGKIQMESSQKMSSELEVPFYLTSWLSLVQPVTGISPLDYYSVF